MFRTLYQSDFIFPSDSRIYLKTYITNCLMDVFVLGICILCQNDLENVFVFIHTMTTFHTGYYILKHLIFYDTKSFVLSLIIDWYLFDRWTIFENIIMPPITALNGSSLIRLLTVVFKKIYQHARGTSYFIIEPRHEITCVLYMENKGADQLRSNYAADQCFCFRYIDRTIPLLPQSVISSLQPSSVAVQPGLCRTWLDIRMTGVRMTWLNWATRNYYGSVKSMSHFLPG